MTTLLELENKIAELEGRLFDLLGNTEAVITSEFKKRFKTLQQHGPLYSLVLALCVDTIDPLKQNRIRFYTPLLTDPGTTMTALPWANPISAMGGFDDNGLNWVPPAGSTVALLFLGGDRDCAFYIGTTWQRRREGFSVPVPEFEDWYSSHRGGYLIGDDNQVLPPWNTESYNGADQDSITQFLIDSNDQLNITYPNIYGFKTPEKHMMKMVDGNVRCQRKWKRIEILSGQGNWMIFKDDHLHYAGQWANPDCGVSGDSVASCVTAPDSLPQYITDPAGTSLTDIEGDAIAYTLQTLECDGQTSSSTIQGGHPSTPADPKTMYGNSQTGNNPFFKHANECRPYQGPQTNQNNKADLPQTGIQILSISGHTSVYDDSVEEPRGFPKWDDEFKGATVPFDYGCNDKYLGRLYHRTAHGHEIMMSDIETETNVRGDENFIRLLTATGNRIEMNDETLPGGIAGPSRGILLQSTSNHTISMNDNQNDQQSPDRMAGGEPTAQATEAAILIKSGYGLFMRFGDDHNQVETQQQIITIQNNQCACGASGTTGGNSANCLEDFDSACNITKGPHIFEMQAAPDPNPGLVFLRAGGNYVIVTTDDMLTIVGDPELNPSDKINIVSRNYVEEILQTYYNHAQQHVFWAEDKIFLLAGRDCPANPLCIQAEEEGTASCCECQPCVYQVALNKCIVPIPGMDGVYGLTLQSFSDRVFASATSCCTDCPDICGCDPGEYAAEMAMCVPARGGCGAPGAPYE